MSNIFLTRSDVLNFSAEQLEQMASDVRLALIVSSVVKAEDRKIYERSEELQKAFEKLIRLKECPVNQENLLREVASTLRKLAVEEAILKTRESA